MKKYEVIEHTADVGLRIYGRDLKELFVNAARGLFSLIVDLEKVEPSFETDVDLKDDNREELLISWLNELIFQFSARSFIPKEFRINKITNEGISAKVFGEKIDLSRHKILSEIKAATYHELEVKEINGGIQARVIFDI
ncbi:MAG: archease [Candidatus Omnitrophica bacterium]|nr:archease [Candidatus Omnitrophota bacterium]